MELPREFEINCNKRSFVIKTEDVLIGVLERLKIEQKHHYLTCGMCSHLTSSVRYTITKVIGETIFTEYTHPEVVERTTFQILLNISYPLWNIKERILAVLKIASFKRKEYMGEDCRFWFSREDLTTRIKVVEEVLTTLKD